MELESQIQLLETAGISLRDGVATEDLLEFWDREQFERQGMDLLITTMGFELDREPWQTLSAEVLVVDCECVSGVSSYKDVLNDICELAGLELQNFNGEIEITEAAGWLEYELNGQRQKSDVQISRDWLDTHFLGKFASSVETAEKHFYFRSDGQCITLLWVSPNQISAINETLTSTFT